MCRGGLTARGSVSPQRGGGAPAAFDIRPQPSLKRPTESLPAIAQAQSVERDWRAGPRTRRGGLGRPLCRWSWPWPIFPFGMRLGTRAGRRRGPRSPLSAGGPGRKRAFERPALAELGDGREPAGAFEAHARRRQRRPFDLVISFGRSIVIYPRQVLNLKEWPLIGRGPTDFSWWRGRLRDFEIRRASSQPKLKPSK